MSDIDKRVVQMDFDNKKFEKNVKQSTESLNTLKSSLNFDGVSNSIDQVTVKISKMEMVVASVISNITNRIVNLGIQLVKSLSIDNIASGWEKFGQKTTSVATLMAQTLKVNAKELTDTTEKLSTVNELMNQLMWFTDETSYSFTDMIDNIGKFTAAGLDLDVSTKAMEGIATWAALSGQNASTASRAMYQLSQAMGKGKIQLIDWKSIQNANMDTAEMRENVLETAVAMGQLTKEGDKYVTKSGKKFTQNQFTEELSEGWFTSDVLTTTLEKYSNATDEIYTIAQKEGLTASEVLEKYGDTLDEFGVKAFKAAQEARTLSDALTSVKDAVASKWMTTSELIFGDKDEAVKLWTDLANALYEVFAESGDFRNAILEVWNALGGREDFFKKGGNDQGAFWNIFDAIVEVKKIIKQAWNTIFPLSQMEDESDQAQEIGNTIKRVTARFKEWTKTLKLSNVNSLRLRKILEGLFTVLKGVWTILKAITYIAEPIVDVVKKMTAAGVDALISLMGKFNVSGEWLVIVSNKIHDGLEHMFEAVADFVKEYVSIDKIKNVFAKLGMVFVNLTPVLEKVKTIFIDFGSKIKSIVVAVINAVKSLFGAVSGKAVDAKIVKPVKKSLKSFSEVASQVVETSNASEGSSGGLLSGLIELFKSFKDVLVSLWSLTTAIIPLLAKMLRAAAVIIQNLANGIKSIADGTLKLETWQKELLSIVGIIAGITTLAALIFKMAYNMFYTVAATISPLGVVADSLSGYLDKLATQTLSNAIKNFGTAILEIASAILIIASIDPSRLWPAVGVMGIISAVLAGLVFAIGWVLKTTQTVSTTTSLIVNETHTIKESVAGCFDEVKDLISESKKMLKINTIVRTIRAFGDAMLQVALAIYIIGQLNTESILAGIVIILAISVAIGALSYLSQNCEKSVRDALPGIGQMIMMGALISSIGKVLLKFKDITEEQRTNIIVAAAVIGAFLAFCLLFMNGMTKLASKGHVKAAGKTIRQLKALVGSLLIFAISLRIIAGQPWEQILVAGGYIIAVMGTLVGAIALMNKMKISGTTLLADTGALAIGMTGLSVALFIFTEALLRLEKVSWGTIGKGAAIVAGGLLLLVGTAFATQKLITPLYALSKAFLMIGMGMLLAGAAIKIVLDTLLSLCNVSETQLTAISNAVSSFASVLGNSFGPLLTGLINSISASLPALYELANNILLGIVNFLEVQLPILSTLVLSFIVGMIERIAELSNRIYNAVATLITGLLEMFSNNAASWAQSIMDALIIILKVLCTAQNVDRVVEQVLEFIKNFINALINHADLLEDIWDGLKTLFFMLLKLVASSIVEIAGKIAIVILVLLAAAIRITIASLGALGELLLELMYGILMLTLQVALGVKLIAYEVIKTIFFNLVDTFNTVLQDVGPMLVVSLKTGFKSLLAGIMEALAQLVKDIPLLNLLYNPLHNAAESMKASVSDDMSEYSDILSGANVTKALNKAKNNITNVVKTTTSSVSETLDGAVSNIMSTVNDSLGTLTDVFENNGQYTMEGFANGVNNSLSNVTQSGEVAANEYADSFTRVLGINSPSKVFYEYGEYTNQGFANGIIETKSTVIDSITTMVSEALTAAQNTLNSQNGDDLTIKVGMDISSVEEQTRNISSLMSGINNVNATAYGRNASYNSSAMNKGASAGTVNSTDNSRTVTYNNVFNVSSTDPEQSAEEIDRKLSRQATMAKLAHGGI